MSDIYESLIPITAPPPFYTLSPAFPCITRIELGSDSITLHIDGQHPTFGPEAIREISQRAFDNGLYLYDAGYTTPEKEWWTFKQRKPE